MRPRARLRLQNLQDTHALPLYPSMENGVQIFKAVKDKLANLHNTHDAEKHKRKIERDRREEKWAFGTLPRCPSRIDTRTIVRRGRKEIRQSGAKNHAKFDLCGALEVDLEAVCRKNDVESLDMCKDIARRKVYICTTPAVY
eukprot:6198212-Pleurochrysis_carterae.AAC.2